MKDKWSDITYSRTKVPALNLTQFFMIPKLISSKEKWENISQKCVVIHKDIIIKTKKVNTFMEILYVSISEKQSECDKVSKCQENVLRKELNLSFNISFISFV